MGKGRKLKRQQKKEQEEQKEQEELEQEFDYNDYVLESRIKYLKSKNFEHSEKILFNWTKNGHLTLEQFCVLNDRITVFKEDLNTRDKHKLCGLLILIEKWFKNKGYGSIDKPFPKFMHALKVHVKKLKKATEK